MGLQNMQLLAGTTISATGGTAVTYSPDGRSVPNGIHVIDASVADFRVRPGVTFRTKDPVMLPDGSWTKGKISILLVAPYIDTKGKAQSNLWRLEREIHPETPAADVVEIDKKGAQLISDADTLAFRTTGSLA